MNRWIEPGDARDIEALFYSVFTDAEDAREGDLNSRLARALSLETEGGDVCGYAALSEDRMIGAIFFSRLVFNTPVESFILSPVAVDPAYQRSGVGQSLIRLGLRDLQANHVQLVTTYGDPAYYSRLGFTPLSPEAVTPPFPLSQPEGWLGQWLTGDAPSGALGLCRCVDALNDPVYW